MTADEIAFWSMIGSWVSGIATFFATAVAAMALTSWRKQDRAKSRKEVKISFINYAFALSQYPLRGNEDMTLEDKLKLMDAKLKLTDALGCCIQKIILCEDKDFLKKYINELFAQLQTAHAYYTLTNQGLVRVLELANKLATLSYDI
ncbi:hypothetical protein ACKVM6_05610 [Pantoea agglomerans]|uniref:hypothetical protein n=1 Tax=Enterobacter agglomerans TaxID=549 RepID=UPI00390A76BF